MAEEEEEKSALARFSCFARANAAGKALLNADCWCRKTIFIHRVLFFFFFNLKKEPQNRRGEKKKWQVLATKNIQTQSTIIISNLQK
jgi:hypothetical protein